MIKNVYVSDIVDLVEAKSLNLVDVREANEYATGHVPGAINLPLSQLADRYKELSVNTPYHIICQMGGRSAQACLFLDSQGYDVTNVDGGTGSWSGRLE